MDTCRIQLTIFDRWYLVNARDDTLAWSGSQWVRHSHGIPAEDVQVSNFFTRNEAVAYAREMGLHVIPNDEGREV
jgi:hypothetical protein